MQIIEGKLENKLGFLLKKYQSVSGKAIEPRNTSKYLMRKKTQTQPYFIASFLAVQYSVYFYQAPCVS